MMNRITVRKNLSTLDDVPPSFTQGPFSSSTWLEAFANDMLHPVSFLFEERGDPIGLLAGLEVHSLNAITRGLGFFKRLFFFTGPFLTRQETYPECIRAFNEAAQRLGYVKVAYRSWDFPRRHPVNPYPVPGPLRMEYIIDLTHDIGEIEHNIKRAQRKNIRHAIQNGLELVEETSLARCAQLLAFIAESKQRRRQKGYQDYATYYMPYLCDRVMYNLVDNDGLRLFHVELDGVPINSTAIIIHGTRAYALLAGTTDQGYQMNASPFSFYRICLTLKQEGKTYLNLGGVPWDDSQSNLIRFKRTLGARAYPCPTGSTGFLQGRFYQLGYDLYVRCMTVFSTRNARSYPCSSDSRRSGSG
jgi:hypothetical protein